MVNIKKLLKQKNLDDKKKKWTDKQVVEIYKYARQLERNKIIQRMNRWNDYINDVVFMGHRGI